VRSNALGGLEIDHQLELGRPNGKEFLPKKPLTFVARELVVSAGGLTITASRPPSSWDGISRTSAASSMAQY
jgi:hypothetical protein